MIRGRQGAARVGVLLTRAEEVGFVGAIAAAKSRTVPEACFLVCMETSSERINAKMGDGPILRVGDKASVFTPEVTAHCELVAKQLAESDKLFRYQRKLMDGGSCETTVFCAAGYEAGALCLPLGNYHNIGPGGKPAPEYISVSDLDSLVELLIACVKRRDEYDRIVKAPARDFKKHYRKIAKRLKETRR